jgi:UrcA family protein
MKYQSSGVAGLRAKIALLMIAGSLGCALGAGAATVDSDGPSLVVRFSPASLATDSGVRDLYRRIVVASRQVCLADGVGGLRANQLVEACRERAVSRAIEQINNAQLAALHTAGSKNS